MIFEHPAIHVFTCCFIRYFFTLVLSTQDLDQLLGIFKASNSKGKPTSNLGLHVVRLCARIGTTVAHSTPISNSQNKVTATLEGFRKVS